MPNQPKSIEHRRAGGRAQNAYRVERNRTAFQDLKRGLACLDCGGSFPPVCIDFDHRDPDDKLFTISSMVLTLGLSPRVLAEIAKCDPVCANCHRLRTERQRQAGLIRHGRPRIVPPPTIVDIS
jgi:hypothetical protein